MNYKIVKKDNSKSFYYSSFTYGLEIKMANKQIQNKKEVIKAKKIILADQKLIDDYVRISINKKFEKLFKQMYDVLISDDDESASDETAMILGQIAKLKSAVIGKYKAYISLKDYKDILKKLIIAEDEFTKDYNEKLMAEYATSFEIESKSRGR